MKNLIDLPIMTQALDTARQEYARRQSSKRRRVRTGKSFGYRRGY